MQLSKTMCATIAAVAFVVTMSATAQAKNSKTVLLTRDVTVAGSHLAKGDYDIQWQTHSPEATISIRRKGKVVATAEGVVLDRGTKYKSDSVVYAEAAGGGRLIQELRFNGSSAVVVFKNSRSGGRRVCKPSYPAVANQTPSAVRGP